MSEFQSQESHIVQSAARRGVVQNRSCGVEGIRKEGKVGYANGENSVTEAVHSV
jgi:hypothetical protein